MSPNYPNLRLPSTNNVVRRLSAVFNKSIYGELRRPSECLQCKGDNCPSHVKSPSPGAHYGRLKREPSPVGRYGLTLGRPERSSSRLKRSPSPGNILAMNGHQGPLNLKRSQSPGSPYGLPGRTESSPKRGLSPSGLYGLNRAPERTPSFSKRAPSPGSIYGLKSQPEPSPGRGKRSPSPGNLCDIYGRNRKSDPSPSRGKRSPSPGNVHGSFYLRHRPSDPSPNRGKRSPSPADMYGGYNRRGRSPSFNKRSSSPGDLYGDHSKRASSPGYSSVIGYGRLRPRYVRQETEDYASLYDQ